MTEVTREMPRRDGPDRPPVLSVSQDWVPILDKVFGQKWCSDVWQIKELDGGGGRSLNEGGADQVAPPSTPSVTLEPSPFSPQQDPRWTPLEDMEVFSPDEEAADAQRKTSGSGPGPPLSPTGSSGRRSSASMLHRLLTLPSQLLEEEDAAKETMSVLSGDGMGELPDRVGPSPTRGEEEEEEEGEEEDKGRKRKRRRTWSECDVCGRRFSRISLLKSHRLTHAVITAASSSPVGSAPSALRCSSCGKRFSSSTRLQSHVQNQHPENRTLNPENLLQSHAQHQHPENQHPENQS